MKDPAELVRNRKKIVEEMEDKYGYVFCQHPACGKSGGVYKFEVHHIVFRSRAPHHKLLHNPINLIALCSDCHSKCHTNKEYNEKLVHLRRLKEKFFK